MSTVLVSTNLPGVNNWNPLTHAGWPAAKARMTLLLGQFGSMTYCFPFKPVAVQLERLAGEHVEIERPGRYPLINRKAPQLMQVSFEFRVADRPSNGLDSIEDQLQYLRTMAYADAPVTLLGFGGLLAQQSAGGLGELWTTISGSSLFRINDLSINVVRINEAEQISQADCNITLVEDRNPRTNVITLPRVVYEPIPQVRSKSTDTSSAGRSTAGRPTVAAPDGGTVYTGTALGSALYGSFQQDTTR